MNNDEIYIEMKCDACGKFDYIIKRCNQCDKKYCRSVCCDTIITIHNKLVCKPCYGIKFK